VTKAQKTIGVLVPLALLLAVVVWTFLYLIRYTPTVQAAPSAPGEVNVTMQTVGAMGTGNHPTWVSYLIQRQDGVWVHSTVLQVPAHTTVHMTIYQYDSGSALRNPVMNEVLGAPDATLDGKPYSLYSDIVGHTFTVPELGISVPLPGISPDSTNPCPAAPCGPSYDHHTVQFTFKTNGAGTYTWQCFVPCALGYLDGFGGPMSTYGFMNGLLKVVA